MPRTNRNPTPVPAYQSISITDLETPVETISQIEVSIPPTNPTVETPIRIHTDWGTPWGETIVANTTNLESTTTEPNTQFEQISKDILEKQKDDEEKYKKKISKYYKILPLLREKRDYLYSFIYPLDKKSVKLEDIDKEISTLEKKLPSIPNGLLKFLCNEIELVKKYKICLWCIEDIIDIDNDDLIVCNKCNKRYYSKENNQKYTSNARFGNWRFDNVVRTGRTRRRR